MVTDFALVVLTALTLAGNPMFTGDRMLDARWLLNPAGQLVLRFDPLHNGRYEFEETYTVILNDRAPKRCGDPDGTGRHTWFFTDALLIEVAPVQSQSTLMYPPTHNREELKE